MKLEKKINKREEKEKKRMRKEELKAEIHDNFSNDSLDLSVKK